MALATLSSTACSIAEAAAELSWINTLTENTGGSFHKAAISREKVFVCY